MSRTQDQGLKYAQLDVGFFGDPKIRILKVRYGTKGVSILIYLLLLIYKSGYYIEITDDLYYVIADDLSVTTDLAEQVLIFLVERGLFSKQLFNTDAILTSAGIQERWQSAVKQRAVKTPMNVDGRYWLLKPEKTAPFIKVTPLSDNSGIKGDNSGKKTDNSGIITQEKISKVKINSQSDIETVISLFNRICKHFSPLKRTDQNEEYLTALTAYTNAELTTLFTKCERSAFLRGEVSRWKATLRWLSKPENAKKVLDGRYDSYNREADQKKDGLKDLEQEAIRRLQNGS